MEPISSSGCSNRPIARASGKRRIWSPREESILIDGLKEVIHEGWRCENGFQTGYLSALAKIIRRHIPSTDLQAEPHIRNKIHTWKKNHGSIHTMLSRSGFSWSERESMVLFEKESIWEEYVKTDEHARGMKNKSYPLYKEWCEIFGNDRATGENAEDLNDANARPVGPPDVDERPRISNEGEMGENDQTSTMDASVRALGSNGKKRKRQVSDGAGDKLVSLVSKFVEETNQNFQQIASRIGYELKISDHREKVFAALGDLGVLSIDQQICAAKLLAKDTALLELFFSLPMEARARMITKMVQEHA